MLDVAPTELLLVGIVALLVIGPKDLPKAMRFVGKWVGKARGVARQFRSGFDQMVRESELAELEKQWAAENERIMREHPAHALPGPEAEMHVVPQSEDAPAVMVEQPPLRREDEPQPEPSPAPKRSREPNTAPPQQDDPLL